MSHVHGPKDRSFNTPGLSEERILISASVVLNHVVGVNGLCPHRFRRGRVAFIFQMNMQASALKMHVQNAHECSFILP